MDISNSNPIITLTFNSLKHSIIHAFDNDLVNMDKAFKDTLDKVCSPENVAILLEKAATEELNRQVSEAVKSYYSYGGGREEIEKSVAKMLENKKKIKTKK